MPVWWKMRLRNRRCGHDGSTDSTNVLPFGVLAQIY
jgi:hypothetical protein